VTDSLRSALARLAADCGAPLQDSFFERGPAAVAPDLLGRIVVSFVDGVVTGGRIVETEAYLGADDPGSHAATKGMTKRNAVMYGPPGRAYVYFTYGNHFMLNIVCEPDGVAGGVLLRAFEPLIGIDAMSRRREGRDVRELANGPGKLAAALGIDLSDNGSRLAEGRLAVLEGEPIPRERIAITGRIGLSRGHELDLRFLDAVSRAVSPGRTGPLRKPPRRPSSA
jgi:DNA-3-methyladenine glycosylase